MCVRMHLYLRTHMKMHEHTQHAHARNTHAHTQHIAKHHACECLLPTSSMHIFPCTSYGTCQHACHSSTDPSHEHAHMHTCVRPRTRVQARMHAHMQARTCSHPHICGIRNQHMHPRMQKSTLASTHACMRTRYRDMHAHTYTRAHMQVSKHTHTSAHSQMCPDMCACMQVRMHACTRKCGACAQACAAHT